MIKPIALSLLIFFGAAITTSAGATTVNINGTVIMPPCRVVDTNGKLDPISIDFGDMSIRKINGFSYAKSVPWLLQCDVQSELEKTYKLRITGTASSFDATAIMTSVAEVGIKFTFNSLPLAIGSDSEGFNKNGELIAVPVKKMGAEPASGAFTATASLMLVIP